jgi:hypothetical protein
MQLCVELPWDNFIINGSTAYVKVRHNDCDEAIIIFKQKFQSSQAFICEEVVN